MKQLILIMLSIVVILSGCSSIKKTSSVQTIPFKPYFQGFSVLPQSKNNKSDLPPFKILIFTNKSDWKAFTDKYFYNTQRVASMYQEIDWNTDDLIYWAGFGPKTGYTTLAPVLEYEIKNNQIYIKNKTGSQIGTVVNEFDETSSNVFIVATSWAIVKKKDVPKDIQNFFR